MRLREEGLIKAWGFGVNRPEPVAGISAAAAARAMSAAAWASLRLWEPVRVLPAKTRRGRGVFDMGGIVAQPPGRRARGWAEAGP